FTRSWQALDCAAANICLAPVLPICLHQIDRVEQAIHSGAAIFRNAPDREGFVEMNMDICEKRRDKPAPQCLRRRERCDAIAFDLDVVVPGATGYGYPLQHSSVPGEFRFRASARGRDATASVSRERSRSQAAKREKGPQTCAEFRCGSS